MAKPDQAVHAETERMMARVGITVTDEGRARARAKLEAAKQRMTPQEWERLRKRYRAVDR